MHEEDRVDEGPEQEERREHQRADDLHGSIGPAPPASLDTAVNPAGATGRRRPRTARAARASSARRLSRSARVRVVDQHAIEEGIDRGPQAGEQVRARARSRRAITADDSALAASPQLPRAARAPRSPAAARAATACGRGVAPTSSGYWRCACWRPRGSRLRLRATNPTSARSRASKSSDDAGRVASTASNISVLMPLSAVRSRYWARSRSIT